MSFVIFSVHLFGANASFQTIFAYCMHLLPILAFADGPFQQLKSPSSPPGPVVFSKQVCFLFLGMFGSDADSSLAYFPPLYVPFCQVCPVLMPHPAVLRAFLASPCSALLSLSLSLWLAVGSQRRCRTR